ncbi:lysine 5,6-aminomutase reactivase ATPase KamC [Odoribacter laneus]|uniref:lysine 5,6-aminomutase reactivase ATPase KamC n=1 Tax=Odoribacter laneus TaxID=626933 RepID=UPI0023F57925|nr:DNA mismatch repair protein MutS [Odoribacter laneus]
MYLREAIAKIAGFRYMIDHLEIHSGLGRSSLLDRVWLEDAKQIKAELERVEKMVRVVRDCHNQVVLERLKVKLSQVKDIRGTVKRLKEPVVLDDLELFELKNLAFVAEDIREIIKDYPVVDIPCLGNLVDLLDPEQNRIPHFYIYDSYSEKLSALRAEIKQKKREGREEREIENLYYQSLEEEDRVRAELTLQIRMLREEIAETLRAVAYLDILLAKAIQVENMGLVLPEVKDGKKNERLSFQKLFHPQLREILLQEGRKFQPVDVGLERGVTLLTGANMAGKSVLLKSIALAQGLAQFGFYVPAERAEIVPVSDILTCMGDGQDELSGLSSFAAEMLCVNEILLRVKRGEKVLVLIDELARTTNPTEGRAIVNGVIEFLAAYQIRALVTTHYGGIIAPCRKLRVRGFREEKIQGKLTLQNITDYIDYSLLEDASGEVSQEAIRIAEIIGVSRELTDNAKKFLDKS